MEQTLALLIAGWRHTLPPAHLPHAKQRHQAGKNDLPPLRQGGNTRTFAIGHHAQVVVKVTALALGCF